MQTASKACGNSLSNSFARCSYIGIALTAGCALTCTTTATASSACKGTASHASAAWAVACVVNIVLVFTVLVSTVSKVHGLRSCKMFYNGETRVPW
jgi:hypothetical protein